MIESIQKNILIPREYHHQRLDMVLAQLFPEYSRSQISAWIKEGAVLVDGKTCKPKEKVNESASVALNVLLEKHNDSYEPEDIPLCIHYEDEDLLVINKPAGLVVHPGAGNREHTLVNGLLYHDASLALLPRAGIVHRLDKDTTGLLVVAKNLESHTALVRQMQAREINRHYLTLVQGHLISGATIETGFGRHPRNRLKMTVQEQGREAITQYTLNKQYQDFTLLNVKLMTGRTHQIRVHMTHINHPVVGDPLYGGRLRIPAGASCELKNQLQQFKRQALHACTLAFDHPKSGEYLSFTADLPDDFKELLQTLDSHYENFTS